MPRHWCDVHRDRPCPDPHVTGAGIYCRVTGVEVSGPQLVVSDWTAYTGNETRGKLKRSDIARRRSRSIANRRAEAMNIASFRAAVAELYGAGSPNRAMAVDRSRRKAARKQSPAPERTLVAIMRKHRLNRAVMLPGIKTEAEINGIASALATLATARGCPKNTYAALRAFPRLFAAAVMDGMVAGVPNTLPGLSTAAAYRITPDQFKGMGINCRSMSTISKSLKAATPLQGWAQSLLAAEARGWTET